MPTLVPTHPGTAIEDERPFDSSQHRYRPLVLVLLLPVYLCPMLLQESQAWKSVYCIALTLSLLLSNEFPSMVAAFLPLVLAPLLGLVDVQTLVPHYMDGTVLSLACAQCLVGVLASESNIVARVSCTLLGVLGLRLLGVGFVAASLIAGSVLPASHPALLLAVRLVERVVGDLEADALDAQRRGDGWFDYSHAAPRMTRAMSSDDLLAQLASTVVSLPVKKTLASRRKSTRFHTMQDLSPDEGSQLSAQSFAARRRASMIRRRLSRMLSFSGAAEARRKSRAKSICLPKLRPAEVPPAWSMPHRAPIARRLTAHDTADKYAVGQRSRRSTIGATAGAAESALATPSRRSSVTPSRRPSAAPQIRRISQAAGRFVKAATHDDTATPALPTATVGAGPVVEASNSEGVSPFRLRSLSTTGPMKGMDTRRRSTKQLVPLNVDVPGLRRESQAPVRKIHLVAMTEERPGQQVTGKMSPKSVLKGTRRKSMAAKKSSSAEPLQLGAPINSDVSSVLTRPHSSTAMKRRHSMAPPRSSSPASSASESTTSRPTPTSKRLRMDKDAQQPCTSEPPEEQGTTPMSVRMVPDALDSDRDFMRKPSILKPVRITIDAASRIPGSEEAKEVTQLQRRAVDIDIPSPASQISYSKTPEPMASRPRMISIAPQVQLVQWERSGASGTTDMEDSHSSHLTNEEDEEADKIRGTFKRFKNSLLVAVCFNSVFGGISNFLLGPATASLLENLHSSAAEEEVNALQWCLVNFPAALAASACSFFYISYAGLLSWDGEAIKRAEEDARQKVAERRKKHGRCSYADLLLCYVFTAFTILHVSWSYAAAYDVWATLPALCGTVLLLSVLPSSHDADCCGTGRRIMEWDTVRNQVSWTLLLVCGSTTMLSQMAVRHNLVKAVFDNVDTAFWKARSTVTIQLMMAFTAAGFAELINSLPLCNLIMPVVFEIASVSTTNPVLYAIPVAAAASSNLIFPSSIPLVILRNSLEMPTTEAVVVGLALKAVLIVSAVLSTNTVGRLLFHAEGKHFEPTLPIVFPPALNTTITTAAFE